MISETNKSILSSLDNIFNKAYKSPEELERMIVNSNPIIGEFALKGQMTFLYGPPNVGKTILIMALLKDVTADIIYLNADDGINAGRDKVRIAQDNNYMMILCATDNNNDPKSILEQLESQIKKDNSSFKDKIIIFDTVKKFVNPLDKTATVYFLQLMRKITLAGGTILLLGHTNKHRNTDGKLIFEGVGDWMSDMDCVYSLDFEIDDLTNIKTVFFENQKSRGVVPQSVSYKYYSGKDLPLFELRIDTVEKIEAMDAETIKEKISIKILEDKYTFSIIFIVSILQKYEKLSQTEIRQYAKDDDTYTGSDNEIRKCLEAFDGIKWISKNNPLKNNAKEYQLKTDAPLKS
ncbi:ATP-binding protein [Aliarcobacter butzleri]|uniref:ATP-binding protein n=1 Tax=Aliarcobacter butzleri TaxID=28197 RepID=UPI002B24DB10|nr:ATP-binding protein [Aliarcobacter butzleri]